MSKRSQKLFDLFSVNSVLESCFGPRKVNALARSYIKRSISDWQLARFSTCFRTKRKRVCQHVIRMWPIESCNATYPMPVFMIPLRELSVDLKRWKLWFSMSSFALIIYAPITPLACRCGWCDEMMSWDVLELIHLIYWDRSLILFCLAGANNALRDSNAGLLIASRQTELKAIYCAIKTEFVWLRKLRRATAEFGSGVVTRVWLIADLIAV